MDSAAQPILCCLGESIEGRATQFCVQRAIEAHQLDWQVISAEVEAHQLEVAIRGLQAVGVRAFRFFGGLQSVAGAVFQRLDDKHEGSSGPISSAVRTEGGWDCWNSLVQVLPASVDQCLKDLSAEDEQYRWNQCNWWLPGESRLTAAVYNWLRRTIAPEQVSYIPTMADLLQTLESRNVAREVCRDGDKPDDAIAANSFAASNEAKQRDLLRTDDGDASEGSDACQESDSPKCILISDDQYILPVLSATKSSPSVWIARDELVDRLESVLSEQGLTDQHSILRRSVLGFASDVYDIRRWMSVEAEIHLIQDAYDEFSAF